MVDAGLWVFALYVIGVAGTALLCVGVKAAFDALNDVVYGEERMKQVLEYQSKQEEGY